MHEINILRNNSPKILGFLRGNFLRVFGCLKDAKLAKTKPGPTIALG